MQTDRMTGPLSLNGVAESLTLELKSTDVEQADTAEPEPEPQPVPTAYKSAAEIAQEKHVKPKDLLAKAAGLKRLPGEAKLKFWCPH